MPNYNPYGGFPYVPPQNYYPGVSPSPSNPQTNQYAFVNGIEGAKAFQVMPNTTVLLMDSDNLIAYMKSANNLGQSTLRYFKMQEVSEQDLRIPVQPNMPMQDYVQRAEFEALNKRLDNFIRKFEKAPKTSPVKDERDD